MTGREGSEEGGQREGFREEGMDGGRSSTVNLM